MCSFGIYPLPPPPAEAAWRRSVRQRRGRRINPQSLPTPALPHMISQTVPNFLPGCDFSQSLSPSLPVSQSDSHPGTALGAFFGLHASSACRESSGVQVLWLHRSSTTCQAFPQQPSPFLTPCLTLSIRWAFQGTFLS